MSGAGAMGCHCDAIPPQITPKSSQSQGREADTQTGAFSTLDQDDTA